MRKIWSRIIKVSEIDTSTSERLTLKAVEEIGEYAQAIHWGSGYKSTDKTKIEIKENQLEEGVDVIICIMASLVKQGHDYKSMKKMFNKKISKWEKKYDRNKI